MSTDEMRETLLQMLADWNAATEERRAEALAQASAVAGRLTV